VNQQVTVARNEDVVGLLKNQHKQVKIPGVSAARA